jgi:hypothetical protein
MGMLCVALALLSSSCVSQSNKVLAPEYTIQYGDRQITDRFLSVSATISGTWVETVFLGVGTPPHRNAKFAPDSSFQLQIQDCDGRVIRAGIYPVLENQLSRSRMWEGRGFVLPPSSEICFPARVNIVVGPLDSWDPELASEAQILLFTLWP